MPHTDFPLSVPHLPFCTVSPSSAITGKAAEFSTNYLVSKVFPSVLPFCNSVSLLLTAKVAWCPDVDSTSESGDLKSVPALWKCAGRCGSDLSLARFLEHSKALNKNNSHLWSTCFYQVLFHIFYMHNITIFLWDIYHYHPHFIDKVIEAQGGQKNSTRSHSWQGLS